MYFRLLLFAVGLLVCRAGQAADPLVELQSFTDFTAVDLKELADGEILTQRGNALELARGISVQTCFFIKAPPKVTVETIQTWNASRHKALGVFHHHNFSAPVRDDDFELLNLDSGNSAVRWLVSRTLAAKADHSEFQISRADAEQIVAQVQGQPPGASLAAQCWKKILMSRAAKFQQQGIASVPPSEMDGPPVKTATEIRSLLRTVPRIVARFSPLLAQARLIDKPSAPPSPAIAQNYWELFDVDGHAALKLGAVFLRSFDHHYQVLDCEYYVTNGYYTLLIGYEVWPVEGGSLVWRADLLSADSLAKAKGIERMAHDNILVLEIRKSIRCLREDVANLARK